MKFKYLFLLLLCIQINAQTNLTTGENKSYVLNGEWQNIFYDTEAQILADFPSGLNSGDVIEISGTVTFANGCTTPVQTGTNTLP